METRLAIWERMTAARAEDAGEARAEHLSTSTLLVLGAAMLLGSGFLAGLRAFDRLSSGPLLVATLLATVFIGGWLASRCGYWRLTRPIPAISFFLTALLATYANGFTSVTIVGFTAALLLTFLLPDARLHWAAGGLCLATASLASGWELIRQPLAGPELTELILEIAGTAGLLALVTILMRLLVSRAQPEYRQIFRDLGDGFFWTDTGGAITGCNRALQKMTGYSEAELLDLGKRDLFSEPQLGDQKIREQGAARGLPEVFEQKLIAKGGALLPIEMQAYLLSDEDGRPLGTGCLVRDISQLKQREQELRSSEAKYLAIVEGVQDGYYETDLKGNFRFVTQPLAEVFGLPREEIVGTNYARFMTAESAEQIRRMFNAVFTSGQPVASFGWELIKTGGSKRYIEVSISLIADSDGQAIGFRGVARDVSDRRWAETVEDALSGISAAVSSTKDLRELIGRIREILGTLIDVGNFFVALYDPETNLYSFPFYSDLHDQLEKYEPEPLTGSLTDYVRRSGKPLLLNQELERELYEKGEIAEVVGTECAVWLGAPLITDIGVTGAVVVQSYDNPGLYTEKDLDLLTRVAGRISVSVQRKRAEKQRADLEAQIRQAQKIESLGVLAGGVAHDFNNLLQAMAGIPEGLRRHPDDRKRVIAAATDLEQFIRAGAKQANQLLLFSRKETTNMHQHDLNLVVAEAADFLRRLICENIPLKLELSGDSLPVWADRGQLEQVLMNLAVNAAEVMPMGGDLILGTGSLGHDRVWFEVRDTGPGIPEDVAQRLFEPFFTTKDPSEGTGLGLSVVHGIVSRHEGTIQLQSQPKQGSTFRVILPRWEQGSLAEEQSDSTLLGELPAQRTARILLVEDDEAVRESLAEIIVMLGHAVTAAASGEEGLRLGNEIPFDLLLTDYLLPGISGLELAGLFRAQRPDLEVILLSGYAEDKELQHLVSAKRIRFLKKPCTVKALAHEIMAANPAAP